MNLEALKEWQKSGREALSAQFQPETLNADSRTVDIVFFTGIDVPRMSFFDGPYTLRFDPQGADLSRLNSGAPVLDNHEDMNGAAGQKGVVDKAWMAEDGRYMATLRFSKRPEVDGLWQDIQDKIITKFSMGVEILAATEKRDKSNKLELRTATQWRPFELSIAPIPADFGTTTLNAEPEAVTTTLAEETTQHEEKNMSETLNAGAVTSGTAPDLEVLRNEAILAERSRVTTITNRVKAANLSAEFACGLIAEGATTEVASDKIFEELAKQAAKQTPTTSHVTVGRDETTNLRADMEAAMLHRAAPSSATLTEGAREYAGFSLVRCAEECLSAKGIRSRGMSTNEVVGLALSTSDFPNILANVANKSLRKGYDSAPQTFKPISRQVSTADFKTISRVQTSDMPTPTKVNEHGEFKRVSISDSKETYSIATYGEIIAITRQTIINDDLSALTRIPQITGTAYANFESDTVWGVVTTNAAMVSDSVALFHASHSNLTSGGSSALADTSIDTLRKKMRLQTAPKGTVMNLIPSYLVVPAALEGAALRLIRPANLAATDYTKVVPDYVRSLTPVIEPRLDAASATAWYLFADTGTIDGIEYCYLQGNEGVFSESRMGFDVDGVELKTRLDFGAAAVEYRGMQKSAGA